jgi:hypothetical protein
MNTHIGQLSTSTPASEISSASFDDGSYSETSAAASLDDIMKNSPVAKLLGLEGSLPEEDEDVQTQDSESDDNVPEDSEDKNDTDEDDDKSTEEDKEEDTDDTSTPDSELPAEEDIDWEYKVPVTINGKTEHLSLEEIRKGYSTDQHLSSKGRELGELKKQIEQERTEKLQELVDMGNLVYEELTTVETTLGTEYHKLTAEIEKARGEGDTYTMRDLKEKREQAQEDYWKARNSREEKTKAIADKIQQQQVEKQQELLKAYGENITKLIPDYSEKVAKSVREFAIKEGIPEVMLESIYDPAIVKFINDYRKLKTAKDTGEVKRKAVASVKSIPTKSGQPSSQRAREADNSARGKVLSGQGSKQDELDFLKRISSVSKKL